MGKYKNGPPIGSRGFYFIRLIGVIEVCYSVSLGCAFTCSYVTNRQTKI